VFNYLLSLLVSGKDSLTIYEILSIRAVH
jgi:hypothetical protein